MGLLVRRLETLRSEGGESAAFSFLYVGDYDPVVPPHRGNWYDAEDHWQLTNKEFSDCHDLVPAEIRGDEARRRVEKASIAFLRVLAVDGLCWACPRALASGDPR